MGRLKEIVEMLDDMSHDLLIFQEYSWIFATNPDLEDTLITTTIDVIKFWALVIRYIRKNPKGMLSAKLLNLERACLSEFSWHIAHVI
jgi:hypothetical protein